MIKTFTIEHFKRLEPYEVHLNRALNGRYVYALTRPIFNELSTVYKDLGYTQRLDFSCSSCLLNLCITLGNYYFPFKEQLEKEEKEQQKLMEVDQNKLMEDEDVKAEETMQTQPVEKSTTKAKKTAKKGQKTTGRRTAAKK